MIAAVLLLFLDEETAFWGLVAVVEHLLPGHYFTQTMKGKAIAPVAVYIKWGLQRWTALNCTLLGLPCWLPLCRSRLLLDWSDSKAPMWSNR